MPGRDDRSPAPADRPPASRVGDELQRQADEHPDAAGGEIDELEAEAFADAQEKGWDKDLTDDRPDS